MRSQSLITLNEPMSLVSESYKMFRTNLNYMNIDQENRVLLFTSSMTEEGKTTSISNAAVSFALEGKKVLLMECDLRKARIHEVFNLPQFPGLTNLLSEKKALQSVVKVLDELPNLHVLVSGPLPPDPAEMLGSRAFEKLIDDARKIYDMILIDAPPVLAVTDAAVLSRLADGVVLVLAAKETKKEAARKVKQALEKVGANILGVLLTKTIINKDNGYYYYYGNKENKK